MPITATTALGDISHVIQLAIAPVFLLTAVGTLIAVLTNRLGRAVDRRRVLVSRLPGLDKRQGESASAELMSLERRVSLIYAAITLAVVCALLICLLIATAFVGAFVAFGFSRIIAFLFIIAMLALIGSLVAFLREIFLAVNSARCPVT